MYFKQKLNAPGDWWKSNAAENLLIYQTQDDAGDPVLNLQSVDSQGDRRMHRLTLEQVRSYLRKHRPAVDAVKRIGGLDINNLD